MIGTGGSVNALVSFYAIGVFTGFSMAGYVMTKHHLTPREPGWRYKLAINLSAGVISTVVVAIFAIAKFTEGGAGCRMRLPIRRRGPPDRDSSAVR